MCTQNHAIKAWKTGRKLLLNFFDTYSLEQLNKIPEGFSNNLIWNLGHILVAQQGLVYRGSKLPMHITDELYERYKPGSKPNGDADQAECDEIKRLMHELILQTENDIEKGIFVEYNERTAATGFHLGDINDAIQFNNFHEGIHLGLMLAIRKFV
jgi:hypothetical protein